MKRISQYEEFSPEVNLEMSIVLKDLLLDLKVNEILCFVYDEIWCIGNRHDKRSGHLQQSGLHAYRWPFSLTTFARKKIFSMYSVKTDVPSLVDNISSDISDNEIVVAWKKHRA